MKRDSIPSLDLKLADASTARASAWRRQGGFFALVFTAIVAAYWPTAAQIVGIWSRSDTFAHGFVVPLIVAWLIWRSRRVWSTETPGPSPQWIAALVVCGATWLAGELATVNSVSQLAFVAMLVCAVPAVLGTNVARRIAFPLAFLFFAVPIGEFMLPTLMQWTADFTVQALRVSGIPVYREGQQLVIPSGRWSVVEACSGIRYLIASFMVGTLYAYLAYSSNRRRLLFMAASIAIPIVANWIRAYTIVLIGHLSNNQLAVGVDHLIYGWIFFGVVMFLMFWVGSRWREDETTPAPGVASVLEPTGRVLRPRASNAGVAAVVLAFIVAWPLGLRAIDARIAPAGALTPEPLPTVGGWHARDVALGTWQPLIQFPSAELRQTFIKDSRVVGLHVAFFSDQSHQRKLVSSSNALAASGPVTGSPWALASQTPVDVVVGARSFLVDEARLMGPGGRHLVARHWYWINGKPTASEWLAKVYMLMARVHGRDDGAIVIIYAEDSPDARSTLDAFLRDVGPSLEHALGRATVTP